MANKENLARAKKKKNDEFYTTFETIENELVNYKDKFKNKVVFCNCDDPELFKEFNGSKKWINMIEQAVENRDKKILFEANEYFKQKNIFDYEEKASQFWLYFHKNFNYLGLKELIATHYDCTGKRTYGMRYLGGNDNNIYDYDPIWFNFSNGDFRDEECINILRQSDIVVTNPPFSLFREFIDTLINEKKQFLIIGNLNAISYKQVFPLVKQEKVWFGVTRPKKHKIPLNTKFDPKKMEWDKSGNLLQKFGNHVWYTNLDYKKRYDIFPMNMLFKGRENFYHRYENYDAINVDKTSEIPLDYFEKMGVPITFLNRLNPEQFEIIGLGRNPHIETFMGENKKRDDVFYLNGDKKIYPYMRLIIRRRK